MIRRSLVAGLAMLSLHDQLGKAVLPANEGEHRADVGHPGRGCSGRGSLRRLGPCEPPDSERVVPEAKLGTGLSATVLLLWLLLGALSSLGAGCASDGALRAYDAYPSGDPAYAEIENNNWADVSVFVVRYGDWRRLGTVTSMTTARFRIPQAWVDQAEPVAIRVEPIGTDEFFMTEDVRLEPDAVFRVSVKNRLTHSNLVIR